MFKFVSIAAAVLLSTAAVAQTTPQHQFFVNDEDEYLFVESRDTADSNQAFPAVVADIEKAGYREIKAGYGVFLKPGAKTDTWCKVDVYMKRQILGECYTPRMAHGLSVHDHLAWTEQEFKADYSGVAPMIAKIRAEHRRASTALGIK